MLFYKLGTRLLRFVVQCGYVLNPRHIASTWVGARMIGFFDFGGDCGVHHWISTQVLETVNIPESVEQYCSKIYSLLKFEMQVYPGPVDNQATM